MKKHLLATALFIALPAFATISPVRSAATWNGSNFSTCVVGLSATNSGDLLAVWTYWRTSAANTLTASTKDSLTNTPYPSAVGPTLQSASNTAAQIFYFPNVGLSGGDTITVTFSGSVGVSSGCVVAEYSGADTLNPLDSVSEAISNSAGNLLDSGTLAPANASLLLFGAGTWDGSSSLIAGTGFTSIQASGGSITEQNTSAITTNNTLQRATAVPSPIPPGGGNWIMQMAVFRAASWTVAGGWSTARAHQTLYSDQFPGPDAGARLANCIAALAPNGGICDAKGEMNAPAISSNSGTITLTSNVTVQLSPTTWTCSVYPCFTTANTALNVHLLGIFGDYPPGYTTAAGPGTVIKSTGTLTSTSDIIDVFGTSNTEVGGITIDFNQDPKISTSGRYGIYLSGAVSPYLHDISVYIAGMECFDWDVTNNCTGTCGAPVYDARNVNLRCQVAGGVAGGIAYGDGFHIYSGNRTGTNNGSDIARWHCIDCRYYGYYPGRNTTTDRYGANGFHFQIPSSNGQILGDIYCDICGVFGVSDGGNGLYLDNESVSPMFSMYNISYSSGMEDSYHSNSGTAINVYNNGPKAVNNLHLFYGTPVGNFATDNNVAGRASGVFIQEQFGTSSPGTNTTDTIATEGIPYLTMNALSPPDGTMVYCNNCNSTCSNSTGSGRTCFREHSTWTH